LIETFFSWFLLALVVLATIPVLVFLIEIVAATTLPQPIFSERHKTEDRPRVAILIPAHNEGMGLLPTIKNVNAQLRREDRLLVVADNCTDDTSIVAMSLGAEVITRVDPIRKGKGYALDWGVKHLAADPPEVLIILDADCCFSPGSIDTLAFMSRKSGRPVQALNLMKAPDDLPESFRLAEFAWMVKNWVRPLGLRALHLPCQLTGTGMAFPWEIIRSANLATAEIVEDIKLGLEMARAGSPPLFCPSAHVVSYFPSSLAGAKSQRQRWEQGHLNLILSAVPRMICTAALNRDIGLLVLTLDLAVPPIVLLGLIEVTLLLFSSIAVGLGLSAASFYVVLPSIAAIAMAVFGCWRIFGRDVLPVRKLLTLPILIIGKLSLYRRIVSRSQAPGEWIRTDRGKTRQPEK
jgi:cellulose synthase/poly-beta-1,6-N-acetylglucosamine synthase-like glycosyltransferase